MQYDHHKIEKKWQKYWKENKTFSVDVDATKPKLYVLDMFPYPSGAGLHVGHVTGYTGTDIVARYKRQKGFNVLHPMGWDSFGLPAERYAVRTGTHPAEITKKNIDTYRTQLQSLGFSYDWEREIATSDPSYYKWTQWIFTKLFERGLAYQSEALVNYCPALGTVLANEEVENGKSVEGGYPVERRPIKQWMLKITAYAERLLQDLDTLDWPESIKKLQRNWIGKSEGAYIVFDKIEVFTTRPDTVFGATYLVLAPEHPLVPLLTTDNQRKEVEEYKKKTAEKSDLDRTELSKEKTGVWTGSFAKNPVNGKQIPVWISDYVLMNYGTGAIMAVPAHDDRDFEFAKKFNLPIIPVIQPPEEVEGCYAGSGIMINSDKFTGLNSEEAKKQIIAYLEELGVGRAAVNYKLRDWLFSRQRYWGEPFPILHYTDGSMRTLGIDELPLCPPFLKDYAPSGDGKSPLAKDRSWVEIIDPKTGKKAWRETDTMPQWAGSCWYYLRFCDPKNDKAAWDPEKEKYWMPVDLYVGGVEHAVLHLLYARFWHKVFYDCGLVSTKEPFQCLVNQGLITARSYQLEAGGYVPAEDVYEEDGKYYQKETGLPLKSQIDKMSKSKLNGTTPDEMIEEYGADTLRLYEMFMGPFDQEKVWSTDAVVGCKRFLTRFYAMAFSEKLCEEDTEEALKLGYRLVYAVEQDLEKMQFNTAIAKMMEFMNSFLDLDKYPKRVVRMVTQLLYPFAPHMTEEIWQHLGGKTTITFEPFPSVNESYLVDKTATYVVQINNKMRGTFELPKDQTREQMLLFVQKQPQLQKYLTGEIVKVILVPNKLISIVTK